MGRFASNKLSRAPKSSSKPDDDTPMQGKEPQLPIAGRQSIRAGDTGAGAGAQSNYAPTATPTNKNSNFVSLACSGACQLQVRRLSGRTLDGLVKKEKVPGQEK